MVTRWVVLGVFASRRTTIGDPSLSCGVVDEYGCIRSELRRSAVHSDAVSESRAPRRVSSRTSRSAISSAEPTRRSFDRGRSMLRMDPTKVPLRWCSGVRPSSVAPRMVTSDGSMVSSRMGSMRAGSQSRSAQATTAGSGDTMSRWPKSCSSVARIVLPRRASAFALWMNGSPRSSASCGPSCPVSPSIDARPIKMRSKPPSWVIAREMILAVASVSLPANAGSVRSTPRLTPEAIAPDRTSIARGGPRAIAVVVPPNSPTSSIAFARARRLSGSTSAETPVRESRPDDSRASSATRGTCFTRIAICMVVPCPPTARIAGFGVRRAFGTLSHPRHVALDSKTVTTAGERRCPLATTRGNQWRKSGQREPERCVIPLVGGVEGGMLRAASSPPVATSCCP